MNRLAELAGGTAAAAAALAMLRADPAARSDRRRRRSARDHGDRHGRGRAARRCRAIWCGPPARRQAAGGDRRAREPRPQPAHPGRRAPARDRRLHGAGARFPVAARAARPTDEDKARDMIGTARRRDKVIADAVAAVAWLEGAARQQRQGRRRRLLLGRRRRSNDVAVSRPDLDAGVAYLRPAADGRGRRQDQGAAAAALCRARRAHQRRHPGLRGGAEGRTARRTPSTSTRASTTPSTTTPRQRATTRRPPSSPGAARSTSSRRRWPGEPAQARWRSVIAAAVRRSIGPPG